VRAASCGLGEPSLVGSLVTEKPFSKSRFILWESRSHCLASPTLGRGATEMPKRSQGWKPIIGSKQRGTQIHTERPWCWKG
jgi:hypothetical protein